MLYSFTFHSNISLAKELSHFLPGINPRQILSLASTHRTKQNNSSTRVFFFLSPWRRKGFQVETRLLFAIGTRRRRHGKVKKKRRDRAEGLQQAAASHVCSCPRCSWLLPALRSLSYHRPYLLQNSLTLFYNIWAAATESSFFSVEYNMNLVYIGIEKRNVAKCALQLFETKDLFSYLK